MTNLFVWGCITPFPAEIIFVALALLSWVVFLEGRWVFFIFKCSLVDIQLQNERKYLNTKSELRCEVWSHSILTDIHSGNSNTIPWTSRQPYHMPLSEQCHPICQNHHSENERTKIKQNVLPARVVTSQPRSSWPGVNGWDLWPSFWFHVTKQS